VIAITPPAPPPSAPRPPSVPSPPRSREQPSAPPRDTHLRAWGRPHEHDAADDVDEFGYDPHYEQRVLPFFDLLYERYFRVAVDGVQHVPGRGRCVLVANHSGTIPFDGIMLRLAVRREHIRQREVRWLAEDAIFHLPFLGAFTNRMGAVRACQENATRLLDQDALVAVFPEGMKGIGKLFKDRYKLQRFGRGGVVKLALRTRSPIVPVAIVGGEETNPLLSKLEGLARAVGVPYVPVTPTFPLLGPVGLVPAPTKWKIVFGPAVDLEGHGPEGAEDEILVGRLTERVRAVIQGMLDEALARRRSIWFG
jgi:1-acyl-sn-glycerol-3-phosphate acyltransferase